MSSFKPSGAQAIASKSWKGTSKPCLCYPKSSPHPRHTHTQKEPKFLGQTPIRFLRSVSCIWRDFRDKPKQTRQPQACGERLSLKLLLFSGTIKVRPETPRSHWARGYESAAPVMLKTTRKESAQQTHTNLQVPCRETLLKAAAQAKGYKISSPNASHTKDGFLAPQK